MYGTVARFRVKSGMEEQLNEFTKAEDMMGIPGLVRTLVYRLDSDPSAYIMAVVFEDKDSYVKNADSPEQDARYRQFPHSWRESRSGWTARLFTAPEAGSSGPSSRSSDTAKEGTHARPLLFVRGNA